MGLRELQGRQTDAAAGTVHQHDLVRNRSGEVPQAVVNGQEGHWKRCCAGEAHAVWHQPDQAGTGDDVRGQRWPADGEHMVAGLEGSDFGPDRRHDTCAFAPEPSTRARAISADAYARRQQSPCRQGVEIVQPGGAHVDDNFVRCRLRRGRCLDPRKVIARSRRGG